MPNRNPTGTDRDRLLKTIAFLIGNTGEDWVTWKQVAREQEGTPHDAPALRGIAEHFNRIEPQLFVLSYDNQKVKLTQRGIDRVIEMEEKVSSAHEEKDVEAISEAVKSYASGLRPLRLKVGDISHVTQINGRHLCALGAEMKEGAVNLTEVPVKLRVDSENIQGKVVGQEPDSGRLYISFHLKPPPTFSSATLRVDRGFLLKALAEAIGDLEEFPELMDQLLDEEAERPVRDKDSVEVAEQVLELDKSWGQLLWGPPGSGKTYGVAHFVKELVRREPGAKILLVAPSNLAVDVGLNETVEHFLEGHEHHTRLVNDRKITRYGYPRKSEILERSELLGPPNLDRLNEKVRDLSKQIRRAEREKESSDEKVAKLRAELLETQENIRDRVRSHLEKSWVVSTTTTSAYLQSSPITEIDWDTVILDEATMAPPALCVFLSSLAEERFLVTGDPRQLGPVFENSSPANEAAETWMGTDIFEFSGVSTGKGDERQIDLDSPSLAQIRSQRRCTQGLWKKVEGLYPSVDSLVDEESRKHLVDLEPRSGEPVVLMDTDNTSGAGRCQKEKGSWKNEYTAGLSLEVASSIVGQAGSEAPSIAIISPYRAQTNLLKESIKAENRAHSSIFESVEVGTVHQFQGSEADVVIFDLVDGPGRPSPGVLLQGDTGTRLVTVATTRARGKLVLIADRRWYKQNASPDDNRLLWRLITERPHREWMGVQPRSKDGMANDPRLQHCESPIEKELLQAMQDIPELDDVVPQHVIKDGGEIVSRADFAFPDVKLAVYCDGARWHLQRGQWKRDWRIRNRLQELGWTFNVFPGADIKEDPDECARQVLDTYRSCS